MGWGCGCRRGGVLGGRLLGRLCSLAFLLDFSGGYRSVGLFLTWRMA